MITIGYNGFSGSADLFGRLYRRSGRDRNRVLGHDAAAALFVDGELVAAVEEERLSRRKRTSDFPEKALAWCLGEAGVTPADVDLFCFPWDFSEDLMDEQMRAAAPAGPDERSRLAELHRTLVCREAVLADLRHRTGVEVPDEKLVLVPHHIAHLLCGHHLSGGGDAAFLVTDGRAEQYSSIMGEVRDGRITVFDEAAIPIRHSLGLLFSKVTRYLGFMPNNDEYKVMGLSGWGRVPDGPNPLLERVIRLLPDGRYTLAFDNVLNDDQSYYRLFDEVFGREAVAGRTGYGGPDRLAGPADVTGFEARVRIAAWAQEAVEAVTGHQLAHLASRTSLSRLLVEGGVGLNCVNNTEMLERTSFTELCVSFGASDPGIALGAGAYPGFLAGHRRTGSTGSTPAPPTSPYLGPSFGTAEIEAVLREAGDGVRWRRLPEADLVAETVRRLRAGAVVGWFQGRTEYGPRALGHRSILADPSRPGIQDTVNLRVKHRETFRPFAPVILESAAPRVFDLGKKKDSPSMTFVFPVRDEYRALVAGAVHVDGTSRIQTVSPAQNPRLARLLSAFEDATGVPCLINTSFNVAGEPIVCSPGDAVRCFLSTGIDCLVIEDCLVTKPEGC